MTNFTITYSDSNQDDALMVIRGHTATVLAPGVSKNFDITEDLEQITIRTVKHSPMNPEVMEHTYEGPLDKNTVNEIDQCINDVLTDEPLNYDPAPPGTTVGNAVKPDDPDAPTMDPIKVPGDDETAAEAAEIGDTAHGRIPPEHLKKSNKKAGKKKGV